MNHTYPEYESFVLGCVLSNQENYYRISDKCHPLLFTDIRNREIWKACEEIKKESSDLNILYVSKKLKDKGILSTIGSKYVSGLTTDIYNTTSLEATVDILVDAHTTRELQLCVSELTSLVNSGQVDNEKVMSLMTNKAFELSQTLVKKDISRFRDSMRRTYESMILRNADTQLVSGVPSGIQSVDRLTGGWQNGNLVIIAARPGMGKSAFMVSAMRNQARMFDKPVLLFSLEMTETEIVQRTMGQEADMNVESLLKNKQSDDAMLKYSAAMGRAENSMIFIDDTSTITINQIHAKTKRMIQKHGIASVFVDYLQLVKAGKKCGTREEEISTVSSGLKAMAKDCNIPVIALAQLSRAADTRAFSIPKLSDLRESGAIEQDGDLIGFLYRPEYYKIYKDDDGNPTEGKGMLIIEKNRNGKLGKALMNYVGYKTLYCDIEDAGQIEILSPDKIPF